MKLNDKLKSIEKIKQGLLKHQQNILDLKEEIKEDEANIALSEQQYNELVIEGKSTEADQLFTDIEKQKVMLKAKKNRYELLVESNFNRVRETNELLFKEQQTLLALFREDKKGVLEEYNNAHQVLMAKKQAVNEVNSQYNAVTDDLARFMSKQFREWNVSSVGTPSIMSVGSKIFNVE